MISPLTFFIPDWVCQKYMSYWKLSINLAFLSSRKKETKLYQITIQYVLSHLLPWKISWRHLPWLAIQPFTMETLVRINSGLCRVFSFAGIVKFWVNHLFQTWRSKIYTPPNKACNPYSVLFLVHFDWKGKLHLPYSHLFWIYLGLQTNYVYLKS